MVYWLNTGTCYRTRLLRRNLAVASRCSVLDSPLDTVPTRFRAGDGPNLTREPDIFIAHEHSWQVRRACIVATRCAVEIAQPVHCHLLCSVDAE